jgi:hypothetical protein
VRESFLPLRIPVRGNPQAMERFNVQWTPTILVHGADGREHHRVEGFLDADEFLGQLLLGLGHTAFAAQAWDDAAARFDHILAELPATEAAPAAQYWRGVTRYKSTGDPAALGETAQAFRQRYADSTWAKKAAVWG